MFDFGGLVSVPKTDPGGPGNKNRIDRLLGSAREFVSIARIIMQRLAQWIGCSGLPEFVFVSI